MWSRDITSQVTSYICNDIYEKYCRHQLGSNKRYSWNLLPAKVAQLDYQYRQFYNLYGIKFDRFINSLGRSASCSWLQSTSLMDQSLGCIKYNYYRIRHLYSTVWFNKCNHPVHMHQLWLSDMYNSSCSELLDQVILCELMCLYRDYSKCVSCRENNPAVNFLQ